MISSDFYWFYIISIDIGYTSSIMTNGNINLYNQLHFTWLSLPNAQCPHLTTTHGPTQQLVGVTSGHCYNQPLQPVQWYLPLGNLLLIMDILGYNTYQPLQPVVSFSWHHNADNGVHLPLPPLPPPPRPRGPQLGTPAVTLTNHPSMVLVMMPGMKCYQQYWSHFPHKHLQVHESWYITVTSWPEAE